MTFVTRYDNLVTGRDAPLDLTLGTVSTNGIELQDCEFVAANREGRELSVAQTLPCYRVLDALQRRLADLALRGGDLRVCLIMFVIDIKDLRYAVP